MIPSRFLRQKSPQRQTSLAIVPLADEAAAFQAYRLLQDRGISPEHLAIVGRGYSSPDRVGLRQPMQIALHKARSFAIAGANIALVLASGGILVFYLARSSAASLSLFLAIPFALFVGACWGAAIGAIVGFLGEGSTMNVYHHHLRQGGYLLMMEGPQQLVRQAEQILKQYSAPRAF